MKKYKVKIANIRSGGGYLYNKTNIKYIVSLSIVLIGILSLLSGTSYAILKGNTSDTKEQVIKTGKIELTLTESYDNINKKITVMSDEDGLLQEETYNFNIKNTGDAPAKYDLKLINEVPSTYTGKVLDTKYIKIGLEINGTEYGPMSLEKVKNIIDSDIIYKKEMINFKMRIWLDKTKEKDIENLEDYKAFLKLKIEATQRPESMDSGSTKTFNYTGKPEEYTVPRDGYYYIEMGGGAGYNGRTSNYDSNGAKTSGYVKLNAGEKLYFYVGGHGEKPNTNCRTSGYEFNGGGIAKPTKSGKCGGTGGSATDVRLVGGSWYDTKSLISRIMVAGGGGYGDSGSKYTLGYGGTLYGTKTLFAIYQQYLSNPGTQISGGGSPTKYSAGQSTGDAGSFGKGGAGGVSEANATSGGGSGGGSGYYGASGSSGISNGSFASSGGSSYISGYAGVNSVKETTTITHTNQTIHYSGKYFIGGDMIEGQNSGNGYAKISFVDVKPKRRNTKLNNVRYIKNCISYNSANNYNHWIEIEAIKDGINIAKGKTVTGTTSQNSSYPYSRITDGDITYSNYATPTSASTNQCVTIDLGATYDLDEVALWNYFGDQRIYSDNNFQVSSDKTTWTNLSEDELWYETSNGARYNAYTNHINGYTRKNIYVWLDGYANNGATRNNTTTTWKDLALRHNELTISGSTWGADNLSFDGSNDYAYKSSGANFNITNKHTIEVVLKPEKRDASYQMIFSTVNTGTGVQQYGSLWISNKYQIGYDFGNASSTYSTTRMDYTTSDVGKTLSYTSTRNDRTYKLYKNNLLQKNLNFDFDARTPNPAIYVGGQYNYFKGKIYSIRVYNNELTEEQLLHNYEYDKQKFNLE